jgi:hypothetical protein
VRLLRSIRPDFAGEFSSYSGAGGASLATRIVLRNPLLIGGLLSENTKVRHCYTGVTNHMGHAARLALPTILSLLRMEIDTPSPNESRDEQDSIIGIVAGAIGEITSDGNPKRS